MTNDLMIKLFYTAEKRYIMYKQPDNSYMESENIFAFENNNYLYNIKTLDKDNIVKTLSNVKIDEQNCILDNSAGELIIYFKHENKEYSLTLEF